MSPPTTIFLTNQSDYNSVVLFRHFRQLLAAAQTASIQNFCTIAASKPGTELHYFGLLWNCAFEAGIASIGAQSEPTTSSPSTTTTSPAQNSAPCQPVARNMSVLRSGCPKPFGSLGRRFRRRLEGERQLSPVHSVQATQFREAQAQASAKSFQPRPEHNPPLQPSPVPVIQINQLIQPHTKPIQLSMVPDSSIESFQPPPNLDQPSPIPVFQVVHTVQSSAKPISSSATPVPSSSAPRRAHSSVSTLWKSALKKILVRV